MAITLICQPLMRRFHNDIDYAMLVKQYGTAPEAEKRYSPPICLGTDQTEIRGGQPAAYIHNVC